MRFVWALMAGGRTWMLANIRPNETKSQPITAQNVCVDEDCGSEHGKEQRGDEKARTNNALLVKASIRTYGRPPLRQL